MKINKAITVEVTFRPELPIKYNTPFLTITCPSENIFKHIGW
jgi:hypothetical protein